MDVHQPDAGVLRELLAVLPDVIVLVGEDRRIQFVNRLATQHRPEDLIGVEATSLVADDAREDENALLDRVFETMEPEEHLTEIVEPDGSSTWFEGVMIPLVREGRAIAVAIVTRNVTERRLAQQELELLRSLLPLCAWCHRVRTQEGPWRPLEAYLEETSQGRVTHGMCPDCEREMAGGVNESSA